MDTIIWIALGVGVTALLMLRLIAHADKRAQWPEPGSSPEGHVSSAQKEIAPHED